MHERPIHMPCSPRKLGEGRRTQNIGEKIQASCQSPWLSKTLLLTPFFFLPFLIYTYMLLMINSIHSKTPIMFELSTIYSPSLSGIYTWITIEFYLLNLHTSNLNYLKSSTRIIWLNEYRGHPNAPDNPFIPPRFVYC